MTYAGFDIEKLPRRLGSARSRVVTPPAQAKPSIDEPKSVRPTVPWNDGLSRIHGDRLEAALRFGHVLPRSIRLIDMSVSVNGSL
jgi:hypothetical protein